MLNSLTINPAGMLLTGILILFALIWLFWPEKGLFARLSRIKKNNKRAELEDALKYLFDCEYRNNTCDMNSIAGNLNISVDKASRLLEHLLTMGLIVTNEQTISLTDTGRSYALRVIRVHRIWERYLADETGVAQADWHNEADRIEHRVTTEDTEKLAAQMGNPVFDPHGDPIPTTRGELPEPKGKPLSFMKKGETGRIIHIEDEPRSIYEQLVVEGLYPGMQVYVTDVTENKITFAADGDERILTPLFAAHITVEILSGKVPITQKYELLSSLKTGEKAEIAGISPNCRGQQRRRLMDLGIVPGSLVSAEMKSASGDPVGYRIMGTTIGIRKKQADLIFINRKKDNQYEYSEQL
ncbi:MAG: metal-dependent transcriptional regulator [Bacteroidales bacterium]|jgi:DtxR family Mn-dependent transcriptional regulator